MLVTDGGSGCGSGGKSSPRFVALFFDDSGGGLEHLFLGFPCGEKTSNSFTILLLPLYVMGLK